MPRSLPRTQATTSENVDRSQRRIQHGNPAGLEHISMIKIHVAEWSSSKFDLRFFSVSDSEIPIHPTTGQQKLSNNPEKCNSFGKCYQVLPLLTSRSIFRGIWTGKIQNLLMRWSCSCLVQWHWMDTERHCKNMIAQCQRSGSICDPIPARTLVLPGSAPDKPSRRKRLRKFGLQIFSKHKKT